MNDYFNSESHWRKYLPHFLIVLVWYSAIAFSNLQAQTPTCILGRPTDNSVTFSLHFDQNVNFQIEYGVTSSSYTQMTALASAQAQIPNFFDLTNLLQNKRYYYRIKFRKQGTTSFLYSPEYTFHTQRSPGSTFTFVMEADEHLYDKKGVRSLYEIAIANQAADRPDFMFSLGDMFGDDHTPETTTSQEMKELHLDYLKYLGKICHSAPFFFCLGNHEGENGYYLDQNNGENIAVYGTLWRKYYYPNPYPNGFYSGNTEQEGFSISYPENYYAFTWGDAQFIVLDVYRHCDINEKPKNWDWTLGEKQYQWFKKTLEASTSKYKFVLAHHTRGQGRGGIKTARAFEWGGYNGDNGTNYQFDTYRPGWGLPIHNLMVKHGVDAYFQGHDHVYAQEMLDGIVYQTLPMPSDSTYRLGIEANGDAFTGTILEGCGHLRVTVSPECTNIEYVSAWLPKDTLSGEHKNREIAHSYSVGNCTSANEEISQGQDVKCTVSPNPANSNIQVKTNIFNNADGYAFVTDMYGKIVSVQQVVSGTQEIYFSVQDFSAGLYACTVGTAHSLYSSKFLVSH